MSARRIQLVGRAAARLSACRMVAAGVSTVRWRAHFRRAERHDRFAGGQKRPGKVTTTSVAVL
jgi:hypothetical protein